MITLKDIAEDLGVSISTVSYVFNDRWREKGITKSLADRVKRKLKEENYHPDVLGLQLKTKKTRTIGVILGDLTRKFNLNILAGIERVLASSNYFTLVCNSNLGVLEKGHLETLRLRNADGIILSPHGDGEAANLLKESIREKIPVVLVDNYLPEVRADFVVSDNFDGSYRATEFLVENGYRKIAYIGSKKNLSALGDRFEGYCSALKKNGIPLSQKLIWRKIGEQREIYSALERIFNGENPDAIFAESLLYFKEGFRFLAEHKLSIPGSVALVGFDPVDLSLSEMQDLDFHSTVRQPIPFVEQQDTRMGELAAQLLLGKIAGKKTKLSQIFLKPQLKFFKREKTR